MMERYKITLARDLKVGDRIFGPGSSVYKVSDISIGGLKHYKFGRKVYLTLFCAYIDENGLAQIGFDIEKREHSVYEAMPITVIPKNEMGVYVAVYPLEEKEVK